MSRAVPAVVEALSSPNLVRTYVKFPTDLPTLRENITQFHHIAGFPHVVGVIDGTHIKINEEIFVNRKGYHSLNVQLVFDPYNVVIDVVERWPGSVHDSKILRKSGLMQVFEGGMLPAGMIFPFSGRAVIPEGVGC